MEGLLKVFVEITILSSTMILMVLAIKIIFEKKINFRIISFLWVLVLARLLFPVTFQSPLYLGDLLPEKEIVSAEEVPAQNNISSQEPNENAVYDAQTISLSDNTETFNDTYTAEPQKTVNTGFFEKLTAKAKSISTAKYLFWIWVLGVVIFWLYNLYHLFAFKMRVDKCKALKNSPINAIVAKYKRIIGITQKVEIIRCGYVNVPITFGFIKPKILIPFGFEAAIGEVKIELILQHELYHIKRKDLLKNYLWMAAKSLHWFNPLVWIAYKEYLDDIELAVDNTILNNSRGEIALEYSQSILDVLRLSNKMCNISAAMFFCKDKNKIRKRVENMMQPTKKLKSISVLTIILAIVMIIGCFTTACIAGDDLIEDVIETEDSYEDGASGYAAESDSSDTGADMDVELENDGLVAAASSEERVGTEQNALQIVMEHNISNSEKFIYDGLTDEALVLLPYHTVRSDDETDTMYQIYDFNGEFLMATIDANYTEDAVTISEDDAKEKAYTYINQLYDDVDITISSCTVSSGNSFAIEGELYKASDQSVREFSLVLNGAGEFAGIMAPYDSLSAAGISVETQKVILSYSPDKSVAIELNDVEYIDGDEIHTYFMDSASSNRVGDQQLSLLASDNSLIEYLSYLGRTDAKLELSDVDISSLARGYIAEYFPELEDVAIVSLEKAYSECYVTADTSSSDKQVSVTIWAGGEIKCIKMVDAVQADANDTSINQEEIDDALEAMQDGGYEVLIGKEFTFVRKYDKADSDTQVVYEFEYNVASPSIRDYSMIVSVIYDTSSDRYYIKVNPVLEELEIISEEDAIEFARQYIGEKKGIELSDLECAYIDLAAGDILAYDISLVYDNHWSSVLIYPDTGEVDTTGELEYEGFAD